MVKLTPTGVKINTNLVWTSHNTGGVEFNTGVFAVLALVYLLKQGFNTYVHERGPLGPIIAFFALPVKTREDFRPVFFFFFFL